MADSMICQVCGDSAEILVDTCPSHKMCGHCVTHIFASVTSEIDYPPKCCGHVIQIAAVRGAFDDAAFVERYIAQEAEYKTPVPDRVYCSEPACSAFLGTRSADGSGYSDCKKCGKSTCYNDASGNDTRVSIEYAPDNRVKPCPNCRALIWLAEACNHATCKICKHEFCFVCLCAWPSSLELRVYPDINPCPLYGDPWYDESGFDDDGFHRDTGLNAQGQNQRSVGTARIDATELLIAGLEARNVAELRDVIRLERIHDISGPLPKCLPAQQHIPVDRLSVEQLWNELMIRPRSWEDEYYSLLHVTRWKYFRDEHVTVPEDPEEQLKLYQYFSDRMEYDHDPELSDDEIYGHHDELSDHDSELGDDSDDDSELGDDSDDDSELGDDDGDRDL